MERKKLIAHAKGQRHNGKTNWSKVIQNDGNPIIDYENPELALKAGKKFNKPAKK